MLDFEALRGYICIVYIYTLRCVACQDEEFVKYLLKANKRTAERVVVEIHKAITDKVPGNPVSKH